MQPEQQSDVVIAVREQREQLAELARQLASRRAPLSPLEARLIVELADARLKAVEDALRHQVPPRSFRTLRRLVAHARGYVRSLVTPRIGILRQYPPKPLLVPAKYLVAVPPNQASTISIVTPSYLQGRFLERTLYSVVSQNYPSLEYVVQDGGSSDETVAVLRRFEPLLTAWTSEADGGQADAINRGFGRTTGEIMGWLNSDDLLLPGTLAYVADYFARHPTVDVVYGHRIMIDENDEQIGAWILPAHDDIVLTYADYVPQETLFWRRRLWEEVGGSIDPSFSYALDWDLLLRFREAGATMVRLPRFLGAFRIHDEQKTTAAGDVGDAECNRLRQRVHGRAISVEEMRLRMRPYYVRHILIHKRQRIIDRLPFRRCPVRTVPDESWLIARELEARSEELQSRQPEDPAADPLLATHNDPILARGPR